MNLELHGLLWGVLCLPVALGFAWWSYRHSLPRPRGMAAWALPLLRSASLTLLLFLLLEPVLTREHTRLVPPTFAVLLDDSASLPFLGGRRHHSDWAVPLTEALDGVRVRFYTFGDSLRELELDQLDTLACAETVTDLDGALRILEREQVSGHLGGVLLVSDGNPTRGALPVQRVAGMNARLWTAGTGRLDAPRDLQLAELELNREVRSGLVQPVRIGVEANGLSGRDAQVNLLVDGVVQAGQTVVLGPDGSRSDLRLEWTPRSPGPHAVEVRVRLLEGGDDEATLSNNSRVAHVTVRERGRRLTLLAAGPSPDLALLRRALEPGPDLELEVLFPDARGMRASTVDSALVRADLLVLVDWPRVTSAPGLSERLRVTLDRVPTFVLDRGQIDAARLGNGLPLDLRAARALDPPPGQAEPQLVHPVLGDLDRLDALSAIWKAMPPVQPSRVGLRARPGARVLLSIGGNPVLALQDQAGQRSAVLAAVDVWRWDIGSQLSLGPNTRARDLLVSLMRWLASEGEGGNFRIAPVEDVVSAGTALRFQATLRSEDGRPRDRARVELELRDPSGQRRNLLLENRGDGTYTASAPGTTEGVIHWSARASEGDLPVLADSGLVSVEAWNPERRALRRNVDLLAQMALAGDGSNFDLDDPAQRAALARGQGLESLDRAPLQVTSHQRLALRERVALLLLLLALLCGEWFWRKWQGML
ncbi:MAG: hypothetical protein KC518_09160 [Candidatus Cloacimonetes bacterium]|nr:hypothetical protein [Candidatus Cloacimonadota bacterium]